MSGQQHLQPLLAELELVVADNLRCLLARSRRDPSYPFVDMKLKVISGEEFPAGEPGRRSIYDRDVVYGVIQGRALEALAGHLAWLPDCRCLAPAERESLTAEARDLLARCVEAMERLRARAGGHVYFMAAADGDVLRVAEDGAVVPWQPLPAGGTLTDVFYAKGLMAAGACLGREPLLREGDRLFRAFVAGAFTQNLVNDRQPMDPKNPVTAIPGRLSHGAMMLSLGGAALGVELALDDWYGEAIAMLARAVAAGHLNRGQFRALQPCDFSEFVDPAGAPWHDAQGRVWCDPGHALEYIGLAGKALLALQASDIGSRQPENIAALQQLATDLFPSCISHWFEVGFNREQGGICKAYDLIARQPINPDMPWWSLPETIRAVAVTTALLPTADHSALIEIAETCARAYLDKFIRRDLYSLPMQTRDANGHPVDIIPAMPDADPLYHTGLSLIDVFRIWPCR